MLAENSYARNLILFLGAVLLLAAPIHAQTLQGGVSSITIGQVLNCNDAQTLNLTSSGSAITFTATITYSAGDVHDGWLYARDLSTTHTTMGTNAPITVTVPSGATIGLQVGLNNQIGVSDTATLTLTTTNPVGQTITIPVSFVTTLACTPLTLSNGTLSAVPPAVSATASQGQSVTQDIMVYNVSANPVTFSAGPSSVAPWMSVSFTGTLQPGQFVDVPVTLNAAGLAVGVYASYFELFWGYTNPPLFVPVSFTVTSNGVGSGITTGVKVSPSMLNFTWNPGSTTPSEQMLSITNQVGTSPVAVAVAATQYNGPPNWLQTTAGSNAQTPYSLGVTVSTLGLTPGVTYQGTVTVMPYGGPAVEVYVSLSVAAPPVVKASPTSLTFTASQGGPAPPAQTVVVSSTGPTAYSTVQTIPSWLGAYPPTGGTPNGTLPWGDPPGGGAYLYVTVNPAGLTAGTYTGTLTVYGSGPGVGSTNIAVTLIITGPVVKSMLNSASFAGGPVSPGEMVTLFADPSGAFGPSAGVPLTSDLIVNSKLPTSLGGVQVSFNGVASPLVYVSATQINTIVPYEVAGASNVQVTVQYNGQTSAPFSAQAVPQQPALFTATATGIGQGAIGQYDPLGNYRGMNSSENPVTRGSIITLYATGEGRTQAPVTGLITSAQATAPYTPQPMLAPSVLIDGQPATVVFYGEVPGVVAGMMQVNVIVPQSARAGSVPVSIAMGAAYSQAGVTIAAQ